MELLLFQMISISQQNNNQFLGLYIITDSKAMKLKYYYGKRKPKVQVKKENLRGFSHILFYNILYHSK